MRVALRKAKESTIHVGLFLCAVLSVLTTAGIVWVLASESVRFFGEVSLADYLFGTRWAPLLEPRRFGVLPLVCGTFLVAAGALLIAVPVGLATAIFLSEYAPRGSVRLPSLCWRCWQACRPSFTGSSRCCL